ncbi:hypothetical protein IKW75_03505 [Candidatus Saccharibacteria bacterium]|nr:hypothetical protein [Candidatus Saccharibacteria bacterium]
MFTLLAQREPTLTTSEKVLPNRVIYTILICQMATAFATANMASAIGKIVTVVLFELATIDIWVLLKISRARYIEAKLRRLGWPPCKTVDFLVFPEKRKDKPRKRVAISVAKLGKYTDRCALVAKILMYIAIVMRFGLSFPDINTGMIGFFYAILVMATAFAIALYDESAASSLITKEINHRLAMIRRRHPNVTGLTARQYELATISVFGDIFRVIWLQVFIRIGTLGVALNVIAWLILNYAPISSNNLFIFY